MNNRKVKHATGAVAVTALVLVAVILFNILFSFLTNRFLWVIDTMPNDLVKISDYSRELLDKVDPEQNDMTIYFLADPDELNNYELIGHEAGESGTWGMSYVYNLAKLYEREYDFISVELLDYASDADYIRQHFAMTIGSELTPLTVVLDNEINGLHSYRTLQRDEFFAFSSSAMYFRGDDKLTSAILSLSGDSPVAYFVEGHGEKVGAYGDADDLGEASALAELFVEAGYVVQKIDLTQEDFPAEEDDAVVGNAAVVVLYGIEDDFKVDTPDGVNEMTRLRKFLNGKNRNLMVFMDPGVSMASMANLGEYLEDFWGIAFEDNVIVADTADPNTSSALSEDGKLFLGAYELSSTSPGSALTSSLTALDSLPGAFFGQSRTIRMNKNWSSSEDSVTVMEGITTYKLGATFRAPALSAAEYDDGRYVCYDSNVYETYYARYYEAEYQKIYAQYTADYYQSAYDAHRLDKEEAYREEGLSETQIDEKCRLYAEEYVKEKAVSYMDAYLSLNASEAPAILTLTHSTWVYAPSETVNGYMLACGSTAYASEAAIDNAAYSNRDVLYTAMYLFGKNVLPFDIDIIKIADSSSLAINDASVTLWVTILAVVLPLGVIVTGVVICVRRRKHN